MNNDGGIIFVGGFVLGSLLIASIIFSVGETYKDGQIDALSGKIRYELVVHPDSTRTWEKKGE